MSDWMIRSIKTFVQAFFGVLIPEVCVILNGGFPDLPTAWAYLLPVVVTALSAAIAAVWNFTLERTNME